jgi:dipeptidyl aminopeptidase/acylaminoacyl peptidase
MLLHGTVDTDVPYEQAVVMAATLERHAVEHELITIPDGPHGFESGVTAADLDAPVPGPAAVALRQAVAFLVDHLKPLPSR